MEHYELLSILPAKYSEDEILPIREKIREIIEKHQGKILLEDNLGKKKLAYPIQKLHHGYYIVVKFHIPKPQVPKLDRELRLTDDILRHLIVKLPTNLPSAPDVEKQEPKPTQKQEEKKRQLQEEEKEKAKLKNLDKKLDEILELDKII